MYTVIFAKKVLDFYAKLLLFFLSAAYGVVKKQAFSIYRFTFKVFKSKIDIRDAQKIGNLKERSYFCGFGCGCLKRFDLWTMEVIHGK